MYGGCGRTYGLLFSGIHKDSAIQEWKSFLPRIGAIEALYGAFGKTGDQQTALAVYHLIEESYPLHGMDLLDMIRAAEAAWMYAPDEKELEVQMSYVEGYTDTRARVMRTAIFLRHMAIRLGAVATAEEFRRVLAEFTPKLKGR